MLLAIVPAAWAATWVPEGYNMPKAALLTPEPKWPCSTLLKMLSEDRAAADAVPHVAVAWSGKGLTLLQRDQNDGMDFAAHNVTIELLRWAGLLGLLLVPGWRQRQQRLHWLCADIE